MHTIRKLNDLVRDAKKMDAMLLQKGGVLATTPKGSIVRAEAAIKDVESMRAALWSIADHIPENWGDCVEDGWIRLCVTADTIHLIESALDKAGS